MLDNYLEYALHECCETIINTMPIDKFCESATLYFGSERVAY